MEAASPLIACRHLEFAYPGEPAVLSDISLELPRGSMLCLAGVNGSGKSTLLSVLAGIFPPKDPASLVLHGEPAADNALRAHTRLVLQDPDLSIIGATVAEDLCLDADPSDRAALDRRKGMAERMGLLERWDDPVHILSHGQKRKLCLASALSGLGSRGAGQGDGGALLLDEPFSGLDYPSARELRSILVREQALGTAMVVATHDLEPVIDLCDSILVLHGGRTVLSGEPDQVLDRVEPFGVRTPCGWRHSRRLHPWD